MPRVFQFKNVDAKIGGSDIDQLRKWYRQGKLTRSRGLSPLRFPATASPHTVIRMVQGGILHNARFAVAVVVYGYKRARPCVIRWDARPPSLFELRRRKLACSPIAWSTAHIMAMFVKHMPHDLVGVHVPEALPARTRQTILRAARAIGITMKRRMICRNTSDES